MRTRISLVIASLGLVSACSTPPAAPTPSLAPREAEAIDPRVPIRSDVLVGPADPSLVAQLADLVDHARAGDSAFQDLVSRAERLAEAAAAPQSESWVVAQQALSAAQAARAPTTRAMGDIDAIAATALATQGGIAPGNLSAIQRAAETVSAIDARQAARVDAIEARLRL